MTTSKTLRFEVFKRDNFTCQYCGRSAPDVILEADHIHPDSKGGKTDLLNLITSCFDCNRGKSDKLISDNAAIQKRKQQLDELQERREQLEMMLEWQRGLLDLEEETITKIADFWSDLIIGYHLNDIGLENLKRYVKRFGTQEILEAMKIAAKQFLKWDDDKDPTIPTQESVNIAWSYISKICVTRQKEKDKPYLKDLYYIRGILRNRIGISGKRDWLCITLMDEAVKAGGGIEDMKQLAKEIKRWQQFSDTVTAWTNELNSEIKQT